ncbi:MAG: bifunctional homocysteine S-methyltransferase/methylenetetrahydrofolate reductase [Planctomycetaceae bacterium]
MQTPLAHPGEEEFGEFLARGGIGLFDGAMGTMLYARGVFLNRAFEELNLERPDLVRDVHREYAEAGAQILETNTFAANRFRLSAHGLAGKVREINARGVALAREGGGGRVWVAGAIGPLGARIEPFGPIGREEVRDIFAEQARALSEAGVDLFVLETFTHLPEIEEAVRAVRAFSPLPIVAQMSVTKGGVTPEGVAPAEVATRLAAAGASAVGVNCSEALAALDALEGMRAATALPLAGQPNAGQPRSVEGRNIYLATPDYLVAWGKRAVRAGARLLGGCCGTLPDHVRALRAAVAGAPPAPPPPSRASVKRAVAHATPVPRAHKSALARALAEKRFVIGVEMPLPVGWVADDVVAAARAFAKAGAVFLALPEGSRAEARMPPMVLARLCGAVQGIEPVVHASCRGRRLVRIQSDLLGACAMGVSNLLVVTGEPLEAGADARDDLEVDSIGAVNLVVALNRGEALGGSPIGEPTRFHVGVRLDATAHDRKREVSRFAWKVDAGAEFAVTAPVFDPAALASLLADLPTRGLPVIATIWPLRSSREAEFFEQEMADIPVPAPLVERMKRAEASGGATQEGIAIARELAGQLRPMVQGMQVVAPGGDPAAALAVLEGF